MGEKSDKLTSGKFSKLVWESLSRYQLLRPLSSLSIASTFAHSPHALLQSIFLSPVFPKPHGSIMEINDIADKLGFSDNKPLVRKAAEIRRLCDVKFDSSVIGVGEICKAVICLESASNRFIVIFDRQAAIKVSRMLEKMNKLDISELSIQFELIPIV